MHRPRAPWCAQAGVCALATLPQATTPMPPLQRRNADYKPTIWSDDYIQSLNTDYMRDVTHIARLEELKEATRQQLAATTSVAERLELVDAVCRLGVGYHFEEEIANMLRVMQMNIEDVKRVLWGDLHHTALLFRLFRENGFQVSQDVFNTFRDVKGSFIACLGHYLEGVLSLYEASHLSIEGENILDEARLFTTEHLKNDLLKGDMINEKPTLKEKVRHALELPLNRRMRRLESQWFIGIYEREAKAKDLALLELAKLDFNMVQSQYRSEIQELSRWWKNSGLVESLSFFRDRLMESFLVSIGFSHEPQLWRCRQIITQLICLITIVDDLYDVYGSLEELELFTDVVARWDVDAVEILPEYMKICYLELVNTMNKFAHRLSEERGIDVTPYVKEAWRCVCEAYLVEAKWFHHKHTPTFEEYMKNAWISSTGILLFVVAYIVLVEDVTKQALDHLMSGPNVIRWPSSIVRLFDDLESSKAEAERGDTPKAIQCYIHEKKVSEDEAKEQLRGIIKEIWLQMNIYLFSTSNLPKSFITFAKDFLRTSQFMYQYEDGFSIPDGITKERVKHVLVEPI